MFTNRLSNLMEKQRRRMIAAMLEVCDSEQKAQILAEEQQRQNRGQLPVLQCRGDRRSPGITEGGKSGNCPGFSEIILNHEERKNMNPDVYRE
jgi:hypothetical protein